ncbi:hypothetical protein QTN25_010503 [Entamoeba marina]
MELAAFVDELKDRILGCNGIIVMDKKGVVMTNNSSYTFENDRIHIEDFDVLKWMNNTSAMEKFGRGQMNSSTIVMKDKTMTCLVYMKVYVLFITTNEANIGLIFSLKNQLDPIFTTIENNIKDV